MSDKNAKEYSTLQIHRSVKDEIVQYCEKHGFKIGRFVELMWKRHKEANNLPTSTPEQ